MILTFLGIWFIMLSLIALTNNAAHLDGLRVRGRLTVVGVTLYIGLTLLYFS